MNPITKALENLGWSWNSIRQVYNCISKPDLIITYEEAQAIPLAELELLTIKKITDYKKSRKVVINAQG